VNLSRLKTYCDTLERQLSEHGWQVESVESPFEDEWWADEIWVADSVWSPLGVRIYLTFLVDPQGADIWTLGVASERPQERLAATAVFCLPGPGHGWREQIPALFEVLSQFRNQGGPANPR
jgi:hypothetical protein